MLWGSPIAMKLVSVAVVVVLPVLEKLLQDWLYLKLKLGMLCLQNFKDYTKSPMFLG
jgi:hypothetical protein